MGKSPSVVKFCQSNAQNYFKILQADTSVNPIFHIKIQDE